MVQAIISDRSVPDIEISTTAAWVQIAILILGIEFIMWVVPFFSDAVKAYSVVAGLIATFLIGCLVMERSGPYETGFRFDNFFRTLFDLLPALLVFLVIVLAIGLWFGSIRIPSRRFYSMLLVVPVWALLQQFMLLAFVNRRLRLLTPRYSVLLTAALFGLLHLPNPTLAICCATGGYIWAREYERNPNLIATAITHGIASAFLANSLPHFLLRNMVVGYNYFFR